MMFLLSVTLASMLVAAIMSLVAWRVAGEERRRSDARVEALAAEIHGVPAAPRRVVGDLDLRPSAHTNLRADFLAAAPSASARSGRLAAAIAVGVILGGGVAALAVVSSSGSRTTLPLELVALGHERDGDRLTVRGVVRNPSAATPHDHLTAVVSFFNRDGGFLWSGRAVVESTAPAPGGESAFVVALPAAAEVERYRVSFRTGDRSVPHVDRRSRN